ncbi:MAG: hypothetical protein HYU37_10970 [Acidobacteria bacterium]|nr:hypothetical protein [Acidobacteriota bacterium]
MPVRVKPMTLWRVEVDNQPGALARALEPLATARVNLQVVMGYRLPGDRTRAAIEVAPISGARAAAAAAAAGLQEAAIGALRVDGDNRPGLGHAIAWALGEAGINADFVLGQVIGGRHTTVIGFESREDADRAIPLITRAAAAPRRQRGTLKTARTRGRHAAGRARSGQRRRR